MISSRILYSVFVVLLMLLLFLCFRGLESSVHI